MGLKWMRKLIHNGHQYFLCLPIEWVRFHSLQGGDELEIIERGDRLIITPKKVVVEAHRR